NFDTLRIARRSYTTQPVFLVSTRDTVNKPVQFINLTEPAPLTQTWFFGDGTTSTDFEPIHTYGLPHDFSVTLEVSDGYCTNRLTKSLNVLFREARQNSPPRAAVLQLLTFDVYPNPAADVTNVTYQLSEQHDVHIVLRDMTG